MNTTEDEFGDEPVSYTRRFKGSNRQIVIGPQELDEPLIKARGDHASYSRRRPTPAIDRLVATLNIPAPDNVNAEAEPEQSAGKRLKLKIVSKRREVLDHRRLPGLGVK